MRVTGKKTEPRNTRNKTEKEQYIAGECKPQVYVFASRVNGVAIQISAFIVTFLIQII